MAVTAIVNQKGGVGKTTVTLGLAAAGAALGQRVLVVDLDPQANATTGLGVWSPPITIDVVLEDESSGSASRAVTVSPWEVPSGGAPVSVVPSSPGLAQREHQLSMDVIGAQDRLAVALAGVAEGYDQVVIDCPPSLGLLTVNALFASDRVVVVAEPAAWSSDGVDQILRNIGRISERRGGRPEVAGIVVNRLGRTRDAGYWAGQLQESHPSAVLAPMVRLRAAIAEASAQSLPITALTRDGAAEATAEFTELFGAIFGAAERSGSLGSGHPADGAGTHIGGTETVGVDGIRVGALGADPAQRVDPSGDDPHGEVEPLGTDTSGSGAYDLRYAVHP